jgi:hypothetical protein
MKNNKITLNESNFKSYQDALAWVQKKYPQYSLTKQQDFANNIMNKQQRISGTPQASASVPKAKPKASLNKYGPKQKSSNDDNPDIGKPEFGITVDTTSNGKKKVTIYGIDATDRPFLQDKLLQPDKRTPKPGLGINSLFIKDNFISFFLVPEKTADGKDDFSRVQSEFLGKGVNQLQSALLASIGKNANHSQEGVMQLTDSISHRVDTMSPDEATAFFAKGAESEIDMFTNYLNKVNDPEIREALLLYSKIYGNAIYGHTLALSNVLRIKAINPDATFVLGAGQWGKYGRGIKANATRYPLIGWVSTGNISQTDIDEAMKKFGHENEKYGEVGVQVQHLVDIEASRGKGGYPITYIGFDIADTYLYDPKKEDVLQTKPNAVGNIVYTLNKLAQEVEDKNRAENGESIEGEDEMLKRTSSALNALKELCAQRKLNVSINSGASDSSSLVDSLISVYSSMATEKANVLRQTNIQKVAEDCTHLTLLMDGIALDQLNRFHHPLIYTQKEVAALAPMLKSVIQCVGRAIYEGVGDDFLSQLKAAMKKIGMRVVSSDDVRNRLLNSGNANASGSINVVNQTVENTISYKETIKENFGKWVNRINNSDVSKSTRIL